MARSACRRPAGASGFALVEALVALAVLAITLGVLLQAGAGAARRLAEAEASLFAVLSAQSLLAAAGIEAKLAPGQRRGSLAGGFGWTETIAPLADSPRAHAVTIEVTDPAGRTRARLTTVRLAPP